MTSTKAPAVDDEVLLRVLVAAARENGVTMANIEREVSSRAEIDRIVERLRREGIEVADPSRSLAGRALAGLPTSVLSALGKKGVKTWGDLFQKTEEDLWKVCPPATVAEIQALVPRTGFQLGMSLEEVWTRSRELTEIFAIPLNGLDLSVRSANALHMNDIFTLGEVCAKTKDQILLLRNVGVSSLAEIESMVQSYGLSLGMIVPGTPSAVLALKH